MARRWTDAALDAVTPPAVRDARGQGFLQALDGILGDLPRPGAWFIDPETCPAELLPALIAERSMEEFIAPGLPEEVQRRILNQAWDLHALKGYDAGVTLGLGLLGMPAEIVQWHETEPMGTPNTHRVTFRIDEQLFETGQQFFRQREIEAAARMIDATKRWSQGTEMAVTEDFTAGVGVRPGLAETVTDTAVLSPAVRAYPVAADIAVAAGISDIVTSLTSHEILPREAA